jgi:formylglycine-generating enzyme required for sulfatase activity
VKSEKTIVSSITAIKAIMLVVFGVTIIGLGAQTGHAQQQSNSTSTEPEPWGERLFNPKPLEDDVILPMPCGGSMTFRKVLIPREKPLDDLTITLGATVDTEWGVFEASHDQQIAGSFTDRDNKGRFYLIGKYEVTQAQYQSVINEECIKPKTKDRFPAIKLSWFDAIAFADRYSLWLQQNAFDQLPKEDNVAGFVRLPTEVEWSFAARGGIAVPANEFQDARFPMPGGIVKYVWFAGPQSSNGKMRFIGLKEPNPLGIHDILGNVDEMMFEPFKLRTHGRSHGQAGGYVVRGGNFITPQQNIRTSWRSEQPYYRNNTQNTQPTTGFRLALVAPAVTSTDRIKQLQEEWVQMGDGGDSDGQEATARIQKLAEDTKDKQTQAELKKTLEQLRISNQQAKEYREKNLLTLLQYGSFLCTQLNRLGRNLERQQAFTDSRCDPNDPKLPPRNCTTLRDRLAENKVILDITLGIYADSIAIYGKEYEQAEIEKQSQVAKTFLLAQGKSNLDTYVDKYIEDMTAPAGNSDKTKLGWLKGCISLTK